MDCENSAVFAAEFFLRFFSRATKLCSANVGIND